MKVFISWSGAQSKAIATALRDWLPVVVQSIEPFLSSADIEKGSRGYERIMEELSQADAGIFCMTPDNLSAPWIQFEAGAIAKHKDRSRVCTYLWNVKASDMVGPLSMFQHSQTSESETLSMLGSICGETMRPEILKRAFDLGWKDLDAKLAEVSKIGHPPAPPSRSPDSKLDELIQNTRFIIEQVAELDQRGSDSSALQHLIAVLGGGMKPMGFPNASVADLESLRERLRGVKP
jgi:hypothetical protein